MAVSARSNAARGASAPNAFQARIAAIGRRLATTLGEVLAAIPASAPGGMHRPQWLARSLGVNTVLTSRLLGAVQQDDPLAVVYAMPGPEPLRRVLAAAAKKKVKASLLHAARQAVDDFQQMIDADAGDRSALDAIISGWLPDARQRVELLAKQAVFRGMSQLIGAASDVDHFTVVTWPSEPGQERPAIADQAWMTCTLGLRRVRPGLTVRYDTLHASGRMLTIGGQPVEGVQGLLLDEFCSSPLPRLEVQRFGDRAQYAVAGDAIGMQSAVNLAHATYLPGIKKVRRASDEPACLSTLALGVTTPTRLFAFDVLLHPAIFPGQSPTLHLYRGMPYGPASPNDPGRDIDRLEVLERIESLGDGIEQFGLAENPRYIDMLRHVCAQRGWDGTTLRGYRCMIEYPIQNTEVVMAFKLPAPAD